jgi:hypothetical protein
MAKLLYYVAIDEPYDNPNPLEHDRDDIYLVWLSEDDLAELVKLTTGKVSYWQAGIPDNELDLETFMETWREIMEARYDC